MESPQACLRGNNSWGFPPPQKNKTKHQPANQQRKKQWRDPGNSARGWTLYPSKDGSPQWGPAPSQQKIKADRAYLWSSIAAALALSSQWARPTGWKGSEAGNLGGPQEDRIVNKWRKPRASQVAQGWITRLPLQETGLIPGLGRSPGGGHGNPLQCSCLENPMDRGAGHATIHGVIKSQTQQKGLTMHQHDPFLLQ